MSSSEEVKDDEETNGTPMEDEELPEDSVQNSESQMDTPPEPNRLVRLFVLYLAPFLSVWLRQQNPSPRCLTSLCPTP